MILTARLGGEPLLRSKQPCLGVWADVTLWAWRGGRGRGEATSFSGGLAGFKYVMKQLLINGLCFCSTLSGFSSVSEHLSVSISMWCEQPRGQLYQPAWGAHPRKPWVGSRLQLPRALSLSM